MVGFQDGSGDIAGYPAVAVEFRFVGLPGCSVAVFRVGNARVHVGNTTGIWSVFIPLSGIFQNAHMWAFDITARNRDVRTLTQLRRDHCGFTPKSG